MLSYPIDILAKIKKKTPVNSMCLAVGINSEALFTLDVDVTYPLHVCFVSHIHMG